jgi:hypothetical protein
VTGTALVGELGRTTLPDLGGIALSCSERAQFFVQCTSFLCIASGPEVSSWIVSLVTSDRRKSVLPSLADTRIPPG